MTHPSTEYLPLDQALSTSRPRHRARASLVTKHLNRRARNEIAGWNERGLVYPTYRGRHAADPAAVMGLDDTEGQT